MGSCASAGRIRLVPRRGEATFAILRRRRGGQRIRSCASTGRIRLVPRQGSRSIAAFRRTRDGQCKFAGAHTNRKRLVPREATEGASGKDLVPQRAVGGGAALGCW